VVSQTRNGSATKADTNWRQFARQRASGRRFVGGVSDADLTSLQSEACSASHYRGQRSLPQILWAKLPTNEKEALQLGFF
jgi:hypothetical protein